MFRRLGLLFAAAPSLFACSGSDDNGPYELTAERRETFASELESARTHLQVPGAAYALVAHGQVLEAKGLGVRNLDSKEPVTADTLFRVGSLTKSMSSALVATRVDEGAVGWDSLATSLDPNFKLSDDALNVSVTLGELLGMGTGIGAPAPFWWEYQTPEDVLNVVEAQPTTAPRGTFIYNNEVYASGVYLAVGAGGETRPLLDAYSEELKTRIFDPIGMSPAEVADDPATVGEDYATSYMLSMFGEVSFTDQAVPFPLGGLAAAGSVVTSASQLAKFLITEMQDGLAPTGERIATAENIQRTKTGQTTINASASYGMGWITEKEFGVPILWHDGIIDGFRAFMISLPDDDAGLVLLSNGSNGDRLSLIARALLLRAVHGQSAYSPSTIEAQFDADQLVLADTAKGLNAQFDTAAYSSYLGEYDHSVSLALHDDGTLWLEAPAAISGRLLDASAITQSGLLVVVNGQFLGNLLRFVGDEQGDPRIEFLNQRDYKPVTVLHKLAN
jgi:CubicO group peptidase (beta-lactamase class C family)